ncbi:MAG: hypothetical protein PHC53_04895 [Patescibacteria group bacterium]|nr:hypothetical protein [Patescibacteria group bacterium]
MADDESFQAVSKQWSSLVGAYLKNPQGKETMRGLKKGERKVFISMLLTHAYFLVPTDEEFGCSLEARRSEIFLSALEIFQANEKTKEAKKLARRRCAHLLIKARQVAEVIALNLSQPGLEDGQGQPEELDDQARKTVPAPEGVIAGLVKRLADPALLPARLPLACAIKSSPPSDMPAASDEENHP